MSSRLVRRFLVFDFVMACLTLDPAFAQWQGLCQNGRWVTLGPGQFQCLPNPVPPVHAPIQAPQVNLNQQLQNPDNIYNNVITREWQRIGTLLNKDPGRPTVSTDNQPIAPNKTASAALAEMLANRPPPQPPLNYQDPFEPATGTDVSSPAASRPVTALAPVSNTTAPVNDNLSNIGTMQMQPAPSQSGTGGNWQNPDPYNTHCTGSFKC